MSAIPEAQHEIVGNYLIERPLAHGSMGHVYVARHTLTYARVALKVLREDLAADAQAEERFLREVRAAAQIGHEGIVKVHDAGRNHDGRLYLAMELLEGETLEERLSDERGMRLSMMQWLAAALAPLSAAHDLNIVHRDLKPANLFIARDADGGEHMKLLDFGLAREVGQKSGTETGIALGTPYYMSPEQATRPKEVGPASDVWSMGVMMYEVLCGQMPFDGETLHAVVIHATTKPHVALSAREPLLDPQLCAVVEACLNKDPAQRPRDAGELSMLLLPLLRDPRIRAMLSEPITIDAPTRMAAVSQDRIPYADTAISFSPPRLLDSDMPHQPKRKHPVPWIAAGAGALALLIALYFLLRDGSPKPAEIAAPALPAAQAQPAPAVVPVTPPSAAAAHVEPPPKHKSEARAPRSQPSAAELAKASARAQPPAKPAEPPAAEAQASARAKPAAPIASVEAQTEALTAAVPEPAPIADVPAPGAQAAVSAAPATEAPPPPAQAAASAAPAAEAPPPPAQEPASSAPLPPPDPPDPGATEP
jgi:serine/threonine-protein kinase